MNPFADEIKSLRKTKQIGIRELAKKLGVAHTYISHIEAGRVIPSEKLIKKIARFFKVNPEKLLIKSGKIPKDIKQIIYEHPEDAICILRESFAKYTPHESKIEGIDKFFNKLKNEHQIKSLTFISEENIIESLKAIPDESIDVGIAMPPFNIDDVYEPFLIEESKKEKILISNSYKWLAEYQRVLKPQANLFILSIPKYLSYFAAYLDSHMTFKYWLAYETEINSRGIPLMPSQLGIIFFVKDKNKFIINKVREPHKKCLACGDFLADWGGKKHLRNPEGAVISDIWVDLPESSKQWPLKSYLPEEAFHRILRLSMKPNNNILIAPIGGIHYDFRA